MKLVKEHINEKFTKDSDPIKDMSIGLVNFIKKCDKNITIATFSEKPNQFKPSALSYRNTWKNNDANNILRGLEIIPEAGIIKILFYINEFRYTDSKKMINKVQYAKKILKKANILETVKLPPTISNSSNTVTVYNCNTVSFMIKPEYAKYFPTIDDQY